MKGGGAFSIDTIEDDGAEIVQKKEGVVVCTTDLIEGDRATAQKNEGVASVVSITDTLEDGVTIPGNDEGDWADTGEGEGLMKTLESGFLGEEGDSPHAVPTEILTTLMNRVCLVEEGGITDL